MGGMVAAIEQGFPQWEIAQASYRYQQAVESGEKQIVGVNVCQGEPPPLEILLIGHSVAEQQAEKLRRLRARRDAARWESALRSLEAAARGTENLMPAILECVRAEATVGEICDRLRAVFGTYQESSVL